MQVIIALNIQADNILKKIYIYIYNFLQSVKQMPAPY